MTAETADQSFAAAVRAGVAIFNAGRYHAAHDAWEDRWLGLERGSDDERFLHGLIQYTAAVHHATSGNANGARGLATSARAYLDGLPGTYRDVALVPVRHRLAAIAIDPAVVDRRGAGELSYRGRPIGLADLDWSAVGMAATVIAEESPAWDDAVIARGRRRGSDDDRFRSLIVDFVVDDAHRGVIYDRLAAHLERETAKDEAVRDLFDDG